MEADARLVHAHLVAPDGREQAILLGVSEKGITLATLDQVLLNQIAFNVLAKVVPANKRTRNPAGPDALDLVVHTDLGPRDLRVRCSDVATALGLMQDIRGCAMEAAQDELPLVTQDNVANATVQPEHAAALDDCPDLTSSRTQLATEQGVQLEEAEKERFGEGEEPEEDQVQQQEMNQSEVELFAEDICDLPGLTEEEEEPEVQPLGAEEPHVEEQPVQAEEAALVELAPELTPASLPASASAASAQRRLETLMAMLQRETAMNASLQAGSEGANEGSEQSRRARARTVAGEQWQYMAANQPASSNDLTDLRMISWGTAEGSEGSVEELKVHNAMLEEKVCELSALLDEWRTEAVAAAQSSVDSWRLAQSAQDLAHQRLLDLQEAEAKLAWAEDALGGADGHVAELQQQLREVQGWLEEEQDNGREARLQLQAELDEGRCAREAIEERVEELEAELALVQDQLAEAKAAAEEQLRAREQDAVVARETLRSWKQEHLVQRAELGSSQQRASAALEAQAQLEAELACLAEQHSKLTSQVNASSKEALQLRDEVKCLEGRVLEYQVAEALLRSQLKEQQEEAAHHQEARDQAMQGQRELQREMEVLRERVQTIRQAAREQAVSELQSEMAMAASQLEAARSEAEAREQELSDLRMLHEQLLSVQAEKDAEVARLTGELEEAVAARERMSNTSLFALERIQALENGRNEASRLVDEAERRARDYQHDREAADMRVAELRSRCEESEARAAKKSQEAEELARQMDYAGKELKIAELRFAHLEEETRNHARMHQTDQEQRLQAVTAQLESTLLTCNKAMAEAEKRIEAKEALLTRWRQEAQEIATKLERALTEHKREQEHLQSQADLLAAKNQALQHDNARLSSELREVQVAAGQMHSLLDDSDERICQLSQQLQDAKAREEQLTQEVGELQTEVDALHTLQRKSRLEAAAMAKQVRAHNAIAQQQASPRAASQVPAVSLAMVAEAVMSASASPAVVQHFSPQPPTSEAGHKRQESGAGGPARKVVSVYAISSDVHQALGHI